MNNTALTWKQLLTEEKQKAYFIKLFRFLSQQKQKIIYPNQCNIFNATKLTPFDDVKVVILGQDPYHGPGQANGLCFQSITTSHCHPP